MSSVQPVYPGSIFSWTDRIDKQSIDFANDINSVASEVISLEGTIGIQPQIESNPPTGSPVTYSSLSARVSDAMNNNELPVGIYTSASMTVPNNTAGQVNAYKASYDPYNMFNGTDLTIPANGWWIITATETWQGWTDGYSHFSLCLNGTTSIVDDALVNWKFDGNAIPITGRIPEILPRWQRFGLRPITTSLSWQGLCHKGDRFSGLSENGTSNASLQVTNLSLKASMLRSISGTFVSG